MVESHDIDGLRSVTTARPTATCWKHHWPEDRGRNVSAYVALHRSTGIDYYTTKYSIYGMWYFTAAEQELYKVECV